MTAPILTDEQIERCKIHGQWLSENTTQDAFDAALRGAARLGMLRAAEIARNVDAVSYDDPGGSIADAIRAAAETTTTPREP